MAATIFDNIWGSLTIKQCTSAELSNNNQIEAGRATAGVAPSAHYLVGSQPRVRFSTQDLATVLTAIDEIAGLSVAAGNVKVQFRERAVGGSYGSGADSFLGGASCNGTLIPVTLNANGAQSATLELEGAFRSSNGFVAPYTRTASQSLGSPSFTANHQLGPTLVDASEVATIVGITVGFGINMEIPPPTDGGIYPTEIYITQSDPYVDVRFRNHAHLTTHGPIFSAGASAVFSLLKKAPGGTVTALTETDHITITLDGGIKDVQSVGGQGNALAEPSMRIYCKGLSIATGVALES